MKEEHISQIIPKIDPELKAAFDRLKATVKQSPIRQEAQHLKEQIIQTPSTPTQSIFSFLPHQLAKTSIFFPLSDRELKEENRRINKLELETSWGKITIEGVKLAIFEEDIFLALLYLAKDKTQKDGEHHHVLKTKMTNIAKLLYKEKGYTKSVYQRIERALEHFELVRFEISVKDSKKISISGIITGHTYDPKTQEVAIYWNNLFFAYFLESMLTNINLTMRRTLKKDGAKALLRFLSTHTNPGKMHLLTILKAINYNADQPMYLLRRRFKSFLSELKQNGILSRKSKLLKDDTVYLELAQRDRRLLK